MANNASGQACRDLSEKDHMVKNLDYVLMFLTCTIYFLC